MFSILFASVVGRLMSEYARWKLERGATLGSLEQLMGSRTVGGTIQTWFHFPTFLGSGLVLLWAFSPLGAQAILRILSSQPHPNVTPTNITYYNSLASNRFSSLRVRDRSDLNTAGNVVSYFSTLYNAVITMPPTIKQDAMDLWGNVKIPILSDAASNDWQHTTEVVGEIHYSALVGVPIRHNDLGNTTFSLESSYMFLECPNITRVDGPSSIQFQAIRSDDLWTAARIGNVHDDEYVPGPPNGTWHGYPKERNGSQTTNIGVGEGNASWAIALDTFVDSFWSNESIQTKRLQEDYALHERSPVQGSPALFENETDIEVHPARLLVQLQFPGDYGAMNQPPPRMEATCNVSQRYVESSVNCSRLNHQRSCRVISQRPSQKPHASESISHLSFPRTFAYISQYLPTMASNEMSVYYLQDPNFVNMSGSGISGKPLATLDGVEDDTIGIRLSQLLNTYLAIAQLSAAVAGEWMDNSAALEPNITLAENTTTMVELYVVSKIWMGWCIVSCVVLLAAGIFSVIFTHLTYGPEVLGFVSAAVRTSRLIDVPPQSDWSNGLNLSKEMALKRVRYGFAHPVASGKHVVGIGLEQNTERVRSHICRNKEAE